MHSKQILIFKFESTVKSLSYQKSTPYRYFKEGGVKLQKGTFYSGLKFYFWKTF